MTSSSEQQRAAVLLQLHQRAVYTRTDRLFAKLLVFEWVWVVALSVFMTPKTWIGASGQLHLHVLASLLLGGAVISLPLYLVSRQPGEAGTRYGIASAQMFMSALLIHVSGGRIETHFHIFGSLAFLGFYRDWKVFVPATIVTALDHWLRGWLFPVSIFGVDGQGSWRWLEHSGWVLFCDFFLIQSALHSQAEMGRVAMQQAILETTNSVIEEEVRRATAQLVAEKERFRLAFENAPIGMALVEESGKVIRANDVLCQILGYGKGDLTEVDLRTLTDSDAPLADWGGELQLRRKDGAWASILFSLSRCPDFSVAQVLDLSERKKTEEALRNAQKLESVGLLAGGIAHEINTPIQYIGDNLRFLQDSFTELEPVLDSGALKGNDSDFLREEIPQAIHHSLEGVNRVACIVRSMKEYSQAGKRQMTLSNLNHLIDNALVISRSEWKYVAEVETDLQDDLPDINCDAGEIGQVVLNMVVNAAHAIGEKISGSDERGLIRVQTRAKDSGVEILIQDSGIGVPEHLQGKIFEPFFTTKEVGKGTGQGLAIAQAAVIRHGGNLAVESEHKKGTIFRIFLPRILDAVS